MIGRYDRKRDRDDRPSNSVTIAKARSQLDALFGGSARVMRLFPTDISPANATELRRGSLPSQSHSSSSGLKYEMGAGND